MIKIVFFDGNEVIYKKKNPTYAKELFDELEQKSKYKDIKRIFRLIVHDCQKGQYSRKELFRRLLKIIDLKGDPNYLEEKYTILKEKNFVLRKGVDKLLKRLKDKGFKIGLISNSIHSSNEKRKWLKKMGVLKYFDYVFSSKNIGFTKIYPECIKKVLDLSGFKPSESIIVGHQYKDFIGARLTGMKTLSITDTIADYNVKKISNIPEVIARI